MEKGKKTKTKQKTLAYVPAVPMLQKILNKADMLDKAMSEKVSVLHEYRSMKMDSTLKKTS